MSSNQHEASRNVTQRGTIELADLPENMKTLRLSPNALSGALNLDMLPGALQALSLSANNFTETTTLTSLNPTLRMLYLNRNTFEGSLHFILAGSLEGVYLRENLFSCEIDVSQLPEGLTELGAAYNRVVGSLSPYE